MTGGATDVFIFPAHGAEINLKMFNQKLDQKLLVKKNDYINIIFYIVISIRLKILI